MIPLPIRATLVLTNRESGDTMLQPPNSAEPSDEALAKTIRVAIVEDNLKFRECLEFLLNNTPGYRCVGSFRSMEEALEKIKFDLPDVALVDIGLPGMSGVEGVKILKQRHPGLVMLIN
ncbi:MAG: response regulator transcription factor, partial [Blastocatellia bacterium]